MAEYALRRVLRRVCEIRHRGNGLPWISADWLFEANRYALRDRSKNGRADILDAIEEIVSTAEDAVFGPPTLVWFDKGFGAPGTYRDGRDE